MWSAAQNWDTNAEPTGSDNVFFPTPIPFGANIIQLQSTLGFGEHAQALVFQDSYVLTNGNLTLSSSGTGVVTTLAGTSSAIHSPLRGEVGLSKGGPGTLTLTADNSYRGDTRVHFGTLRVEGGGSIGDIAPNFVPGDALIGTGSGLAASAVVSGAGTIWIANNSFQVGTSGSTGTLSIEAGGGVSVVTTSIGVSLGTGTVTVSGPGSTLTNSNLILVGETGPGSLIVEAGGTLSGHGIVGNTPTAPGTATITGAGSTWNSETLVVGGNSTGTLTIAAGGSVSSDFAVLGDGGTGSGNANVSGASSTWTISGHLLMSGGEGTTGTLNITGGTVSIGGNVVNASGGTSTITLDGGTLDLTGGNIGDATPISVLNFRAGTLKNVAQINGGGLAKTGTGTLTLDGVNTYTGTTTVTQGTLVFKTSYASGSAVDVADGSTARIAPSVITPNNVVLKTPSVQTHASGKLDLCDNKLIVAGGSVGSWNGSAYTGVSGLVDAGRGNASNAQWNGSGIVTTDTRAVNNNDLCSIGVERIAKIKNIAATATTTFAGQTVLGSDVVAMFTWGGDANLDGKINIDDYGQIDFNVGSSGSVFGWFNGDFNYDGKINIDDYGIIDFNVVAQNATFATVESAVTDGVASVPEPAGMMLGALAPVLLSRRGRRRARG